VRATSVFKIQAQVVDFIGLMLRRSEISRFKSNKELIL
jgi:hypothetical protein